MTQNTSSSHLKGISPLSIGNKPNETSIRKRNNKKKTKRGKPKQNKNQNAIPLFTGSCMEDKFKNFVMT